jgi:hypothetical protein
MKRYLIRVTQSINHDYLIDAESLNEALFQFEFFSADDLKKKDVDCESSWGKPWFVEEIVTCHTRNYGDFLCPNCDDPNNGSRCMRGYCAVCLTWLDHDSNWGDCCRACQPY